LVIGNKRKRVPSDVLSLHKSQVTSHQSLSTSLILVADMVSFKGGVCWAEALGGEMAKKKKAARRDRGGKRTRFHLSRRGETILAWAGGVVAVVVLALLFLWARATYFAPNPQEASRIEAAHRKDAALCESLMSKRILLSPKPQDDSLIVDRGKWLAMSLAEREEAAGAVARHFGQKRLFLLDGSGATVAWYLVGAGYKEPSDKP
jgi:hypothetical protein